MVARFLYRLVSLFFLLGAIACWLGGALGVSLQVYGIVAGKDFSWSLIPMTIWAFVLAVMCHDGSISAWRAACIHHVRYD